MLFKGQVWEIDTLFDRAQVSSHLPQVLIQSPDATLEKFIVDDLIKKMEIEFRPELSSEINGIWIEENLSNLDLFTSSKAFFFLKAEELDIGLVNQVGPLFSGLSDYPFIMSFVRPKANMLKQMKGLEFAHFHFEMPPFWKATQLIEWMAKQLEIPLSRSESQWIEDNLPYESSVIREAILKIGRGGLENLENEYLNVFDWSELFLSLKFKEAFTKAYHHWPKGQSNEELWRFMQTLLSKVVTLRLEQKKTGALPQSRYDKKIFDLSKRWPLEKIRSSLQWFNELQLKERQGNQTLSQQELLKKLLAGFSTRSY